MLKGKKIIVGICGGIAAYKGVELVRELTKCGAVVKVVLTAAAQKFVTPLSLETLSGNPVYASLFPDAETKDIKHISLAGWADVLLVAPATANTIAKFSHGLADDMLSTIFLASTAPTLMAPAMNMHMYRNPITQENIQKLKKQGVNFTEVGVGALAEGVIGEGRLIEVGEIIRALQPLLAKQTIWQGKKVLVTAGRTVEAIDPVRYISNHSSGKMGIALAQEARLRGAEVCLVCGKVDVPIPEGLRAIQVTSAAELHKQVLTHAKQQDLIIMAAAVADFRPATFATRKIKKHKQQYLSINIS